MRLRVRLDTAFVVGLALVLAMGGMSWFGASLFLDTVERNEQETETAQALDEVLEDMIDVETGARGYVIAGSDDFLAPYTRGRAEIAADLERLRAHLRPSDALRRLETSIEAELADAANDVEVRRRDGGDAAAAVVRGGHGRIVMEDIRRAIAEIRTTLADERRQLLARDGSRTRAAIASIALGCAAMLVLVVVAGLMVRRSIVRPLSSLATAAVRAGRADWQRPPNLRDDEIGELERSLAAMVTQRREAEARVDELVDDAPEPFFLADLDGRYTRVNRAACDLLGYTQAELLGKTKADLIPSEDHARLAEIKKRLLEPGTVDVSEWRLRTKSGALVPVEISGKILPGGRWQTFVRDLSDRDAAIRARESLISVVSHDLKNPLNAIELRATLIERRATEPTLKDSAASVRRTVATMQRMIRGLLDAASIQAGKLQIVAVDADLADVVREVADVLGPVASERGIELAVTAEPGTVRRFDPDRIEQVVFNLVSNALKFTPEGGRVGVDVRYADDASTISVSDTGAGIAPEALPRIFDRFFTTGGRFGGTGLGLDIAKGLVDAHGGKIWATSTVGAGSTFALSLPVR